MKENEKGQQNNYDILYAEKRDINKNIKQFLIEESKNATKLY